MAQEWSSTGRVWWVQNGYGMAAITWVFMYLPVSLVVTYILMPLMSTGVSCLMLSSDRINHSRCTWCVNSFSLASTSLVILVNTGLRFWPNSITRSSPTCTHKWKWNKPQLNVIVKVSKCATAQHRSTCATAQRYSQSVPQLNVIVKVCHSSTS